MTDQATCGCLSGRDCRCKIHNRNHNQCLPSDPAEKTIEKGRTFNHRDGMSELRRFEMETKARELLKAFGSEHWSKHEGMIAAALEAEYQRGVKDGRKG